MGGTLPLTIGRREVLVFLTRPEALAEPGRRDAAFTLLSPDDRAHVDRFKFDRDREVALASRALERRVLGAYVAVPGLRFNVSNTRGLVGCAITVDCDIGFDLEPWRPDAPPELVAACLSPGEQAALGSLPPEARARRFVELWVLKEAYIKARRLGLSLPLEKIDFTLDDGPPSLGLDASLGDDPATWQLALWSPTASHAAALCVRRGDGPAFTIDRRWDPG